MASCSSWGSRCRPTNRRQVHGPPATSCLRPNLDYLPAKPLRTNGFDRFSHGAHSQFSRPLCVRGPVARSSPNSPLQRDGHPFWTALREAFPFTPSPKYLLRDRDAFMDWNSSTSHKLWRLRNSGLRPVRPGSRRMWNGSSVRSAVVPLEATRRVLNRAHLHRVFLKGIWLIITVAGRTWVWIKMLRRPGGCSCPQKARLSPSPRSVASIIATDAGGLKSRCWHREAERRLPPTFRSVSVTPPSQWRLVGGFLPQLEIGLPHLWH